MSAMPDWSSRKDLFKSPGPSLSRFHCMVAASPQFPLDMSAEAPDVGVSVVPVEVDPPEDR
jgi:hypothetical protein